MKTSLLFVFALVLSPLGYTQPVKVNVVAVDSIDDFKRWLGKPIDPARAAAAAAYPGRLSQLPFGRKTQLPILVTGVPALAQETRLVADVEILGTDGRSLGISPRCCQATIARGSNERAVLLDQTVIVEPEAGHRKGTYTVRVSVTDGTQTWTTSEGPADACRGDQVLGEEEVTLTWGAAETCGWAGWDAPRCSPLRPAGSSPRARSLPSCRAPR